MYPLIGNNSETNETTAISKQQLCKYVTVLELLLGSGRYTTMEVLLEVVFFYMVHSEAISLDRPS
jgi:hypothetical protein